MDTKFENVTGTLPQENHHRFVTSCHFISTPPFYQLLNQIGSVTNEDCSVYVLKFQLTGQT